MADPGELPHPPLPTVLVLDQTEARGPKTTFWRTALPPPPPSQGLDDQAPPLSEGLDTPLWYKSYQQSVSFALRVHKSNQNPHRLVCHCLAKQLHYAVN